MKQKWPECEEFYDLMQTYRHVPPEFPVDTLNAYESVKKWIRRHREQTWLDRNYRCLMMISMGIELLLLMWIAWRA
jgi:hypothetical protein